MKTTCPKCSKIDDYRGKSGRKKCTRCGHKYKVTPKTHPTTVDHQKQTVKERYFLSELDILILTHLKISNDKGMYQQQLATKTGYSRQSIQKRLKKLKKDGLVKQDPIAYPKIWRLNPQPYASTHKHQFVCDILHGKPKISAKKTIKMRHWEKKIFEIWIPRERIWVQNAELNTKSIVFWLETEEKTTELAIQKANDHAFLVKKHLETKYSKYSLKLSHPKYMKELGNQDAHTLPKYGTKMIDRDIDPRDPTLSTNTWTDNTPEKDTVESGVKKGEHKAWFDNVNFELPKMSEDIGDIRLEIKELASQFSDFRMIVTQIMNTMKMLSNNQSNTNEKIEVGFKAMSDAVGDAISDTLKHLLQKTNKTETQEPQPEVKDQDERDKEPSNIYL